LAQPRVSKKARRSGAVAPSPNKPAMLPLAAFMLAASASGWAQEAPKPETAETPLADSAPTKADAPVVLAQANTSNAPAGDKTLKQVTVTEQKEELGKDSVRATTTTIGKGKQELRDIPQSITVITEKLINDRNLDTVKEVLHSTAGVSFLAAEGGEEDIRLRGFSLQGSGDIFVDGIRDPAFYDRDTFALDRLELLRGSASLLFGRGSTGGAVNQVTAQPQLADETVITTTIGNHEYRRFVGDFNIRTAETAALRFQAMKTNADNNGAGSSINKNGFNAGYTWGIGTDNEFNVNLYNLENYNGINYGIPWIRPNATSLSQTIVPIDPSNYYGAGSDRNNGGARHLTLGYTHRFNEDSELKSVIRKGYYDRDQRAGTIRFAGTRPANGGTPGTLYNPATVTLENLNNNSVLNRGAQNKIQDLDTVYAQSDYSGKFQGIGGTHNILAGIDYSNEKFNNFNASGAAGTKPQTFIGTPNDGGSVDENLRVITLNRHFEARNIGLYGQDLLQISPHWKILGGLRYDNFKLSNQNASANFGQSESLFSRRFGVIFQPNPLHSYHVSYGTSFNTSGDAYILDDQTQNTPPESSENFEIGAKLDSADKRFTTRLAFFHSVKKNERNRDPLVTATQNLLSGKRHATGFDLDISGRLTPQLEVFGSYAWIPEAKIDIGAPGATPNVGEGPGTRPSITPRHSGTLFATYQLSPQFRFGGGINFRSKQTPIRNPAGIVADRFLVADLLAEYKFTPDLALKLNVSNVTNKLYADSLYSGHYVPGTGRLVQLSLTAKF
jgi:catecholate siderophore receptor